VRDRQGDRAGARGLVQRWKGGSRGGGEKRERGGMGKGGRILVSGRGRSRDRRPRDHRGGG